jgi:protein tyrosine/serine phosphatase
VTALVWDGCVNVRDLGGLPTSDGGVTRFNRVVRADNVRGLSADGWSALVRHGVKRIVDLRFPEEMVGDLTGDVPVEVVHVSVLGDRRTEEWQAEQNAAMDAATDVTSYLVWSYGVFLELYRDRFAAAVRAVADAPEGAVLVHCMGGKDRTGLLAALLLRVAGVPADAVAADYSLTEDNLAASAAEWIAAAVDEADRRRRILLQPAPADAMRGVLAGLDTRYGGVREYLREAGVDEDALDRIRTRLVAA